MYNWQHTHLFDRSRFNPEQCRAIGILEDNFSKWTTSIQNEPLTLERICTQDEMFFTELAVSTSSLPRGETWSWNQSRARETIISTHGNISVCFYKLSTRKTPKATEKAPVVKIWIYNIIIPILGERDKPVNFLWCEKGFERQSTSGTSGT